MRTWLVGAGPMGISYHRVLKVIGEPVKVIGRGMESASKFESETGQPVNLEGLDIILENEDPPEQAILAVSINNLFTVASSLIRSGTKRLLLEKPGALNLVDLTNLSKLAVDSGSIAFIGYNRRFYAATLAAEAMIEGDGGAISCRFEFTEWSNTIAPLEIDPGIKQNWVYSNSSHVTDLAFYLCGLPIEMTTYHGGRLDWHSSAARFVGAGITENGVFFSYHADWEAPGRWGVEIMTRKRRYIFSPLETLRITETGLTEQTVAVDYSLDQTYKPGLFLQTKAFLDGDDRRFCGLVQQEKNFAVYAKMAGYS